MVCRGETFQACPQCNAVGYAADTVKHVPNCNGTPSPQKKKARINAKKSAAYDEARQAFLSAAARMNLVPFVIRCRNCPRKVQLQKRRNSVPLERGSAGQIGVTFRGSSPWC
ncbi:unnamed protein product [Cladocopium goreaui]|uniref:Uncharacterized protein n=1 Tax=Cladocopium goreaui TaxID=2562237 RepID=A0A9P1C2Z7_9DINO|nr:unnamed protein product [Cladocopium goreaui]